ncbi:hypothetical protein POM88_033555 [Heracleum sosnowskyi]|uniref:Uncharacterized protein n=1 Tax=Heracleum sosnowskyi TaxID=360622 RepID=A0AAD8I1D6_9APIA|nr:hypothetical protein POM88_033555 [Heracleum sosnowskyi]
MAVVRHVPVNPCCELLQKKESKLSQKLAKSEEGRNFLKKAIGILQDKIAIFEAEKVELKEELELARKKTEDDSDKNNQDFASRDTLDKEISALRSEISSLKQKVADSEWEKEMSILKDQLQKEQKMAEIELNKANEALQTAKAEMARVEKLHADNEREMKVNESTIRVSLENEISCLKSQITVLQQQTVSAAQDANKEATLLQECVSGQREEINRFKELLQIEKDRADSEKKKAEEAREKADDDKYRAEKVLSERETELRVKESAVRLSLEDEISSLKSQIALLQEPAVLGAQDVNKDINLLRDCISNKEKEINQLHELLQIEKDRADFERNKAEEERKKVDEKRVWAEKLIAENERKMKIKESAVRLPLENEISSLKSQINLCGSERETEINRLKKLLQKEEKRADSEKKKAETEKCRADKVLADSEITLKEKEQAVRLSLGAEISALESQIHLLQQEITVRDEKKEVNLYQSLVSEKEAEINQLKQLAEKERTRAESEKKTAEAGKKKVYESQKIAKTEKSRANEERRLADIERKKAEEAGLQLEMLRDEVHDLRANLELEALKVQQANEILETEKQKVMTERQRADMEMAKAEEQSKLLETTRKEMAEERARSDSSSLQLEEDRGRIMKLQKEIAELVSSRNTGKDAGDLSIEHLGLEAVKLKGGPKMVLNCLQCEELIKKLKDVKQEAKREKERADSEMRKAKMETDRCLELADELEDNRCKTEKLKKEMQELVSSGKPVVTVERKKRNSDTTNMKLLKKSLKLERMQTNHAKQVASLERDRNILLQQEIRRIKEAFSGITDQLDILDKCSSHGDVGINDLEKNSNVSRRQGKKRKILNEDLCQVHHSGNELMKSSSPLDTYDAFKHRKQCTAPILSCMTSVSDRALLGSQKGRDLSVSESDKLAEGATNLQLTVPGSSNNISKPTYNKKFVPFAEKSIRCPLRINAVGHKAGHDENRKRSLDAVESAEHMYREGKKRCRQIAESVSVLEDMLECSIGKRFKETGGMLPSINCANQEIKNPVSPEELAMQHLNMSDELKTHSHPTDSRPMSDVIGITHACNEETGDASRNHVGGFDEVEDGDYLKLLSLIILWMKKFIVLRLKGPCRQLFPR